MPSLGIWLHHSDRLVLLTAAYLKLSPQRPCSQQHLSQERRKLKHLWNSKLRGTCCPTSSSRSNSHRPGSSLPKWSTKEFNRQQSQITSYRRVWKQKWCKRQQVTQRKRARQWSTTFKTWHRLTLPVRPIDVLSCPSTQWLQPRAVENNHLIRWETLQRCSHRSKNLRRKILLWRVMVATCS